MSTKRKWTEDEELVILRKIEANPSNLQEAFRQASVILGRSSDCCCQKWYRGGLRERSEVLFLVYGRKGTLVENRKIISDNCPDNIKKVKKSLWKRIFELLHK